MDISGGWPKLTSSDRILEFGLVLTQSYKPAFKVSGAVWDLVFPVVYELNSLNNIPPHFTWMIEIIFVYGFTLLSSGLIWSIYFMLLS